MMNTPKTRVLLGMSGGLDSTYAARLLQKAGYEVVGAVLVFSEHTDTKSAEIAASEVGIDLIRIDAKDRFAHYVIDNFVTEYENGRTPNPCVVCNRYVKMALLYEEAKKQGFAYYATGHYARVVKENGRFALAVAQDLTKDQSYMLWGLSQDMLSMLLTPLADAEKKAVREEALAVSLSAAKEKESQDICFIPDGDYVGFIRRYRGKEAHRAFEAGNFVSPTGEVLGKHRGIVHYTVGQRKHLGVALGYPAFVTAIDPETLTVTLSSKEETARDTVYVKDLVFQALCDANVGDTVIAEVKIRYAAKPVPCRVTFEETGAFVRFDTPQRTPCKGQSAVFYKNGTVLFGGVIA
ncbi:MAG: tRNA 2-thiouridine(34) synthase MnmA [Clostridia bacterium]|nr:tRNA 2-thiouridine(34) synthase MnmA [Clostridia bacterium]